MIKVNLLGDVDYDGSSATSILAYSIGILVIGVLSVGYIYLTTSKKLHGLKLEQTALQSDLSTLEERTKAVKDLDQKRKVLKNKLSLIAKLKKSKIGPVRVMDDLNIAIPAKVWIREVKETTGTMKIKGRALNNQHIATLMQNLSESDYFDQVELVESRQMFYSRSTGKVTPMTDVARLKAADFTRDARVTKQDSRSLKTNTKPDVVVRDGNKEGKSAISRVKEANVTVNEFVLSVKVHYSGKPLAVQVASKDASAK